VPAQTDFVCIPCDPPTEIDVYINRELVAENATEDVLLILQDQDENLLNFTQVDDTLTVNIPPCDTNFDVIVNVNGVEIDNFTLDSSEDNTININV
jgi:hypothetical protein